jgi:signal transduction histidine kinase
MRPNAAWILLILLVEALASVVYPLLRARFPWRDRAWWRFAIDVDVAATTTCIFFLGPQYEPLGLTVYAFFVVYAAAGVSGRECAITAVRCVAAYALLVVFRGLAVIPVPESAFAAPAASHDLVNLLFLVLLLIAMAVTAGDLADSLRREQAKRLAAQADLQRANAELRAVNQELEAKADEMRGFVYTVTHDLKNPVTAIGLGADLLLRDEQLSAQGAEELERIVRLAGRTEDMIRDLMELFRVTTDAEEPRWVDLRAVANEVVDALGPQIAAKRAAVSVGALPRVWGQAAKLHCVLTNLVANAVKYVPTGAGRIEVAGESANGTARFWVRDNGIGIASNFHEGIFDLFTRVPKQEVDGAAVAGSGVGLALVKRVVAAHGGLVGVESTPGVGSRFWVALPTREDAAA